MATYAIGDVQGCWRTLRQLLERIDFDRTVDRLWFVGDLVNRGPASLDVLRYVMSLGDCATTVLGNHDLHLLALAAGVGKRRKRDSLDQVLEATDRDALLDWLSRRPLVVVAGDWLLVHAGLLPEWSPADAVALSAEMERALQGDMAHRVFAPLDDDDADVWDPDLSGKQRLRVIVNGMTRIRVCTAEGRMDLSFKGPPKDLDSDWYPWFEVPKRRSRDVTVVSGHWAALGLHITERIIAIDTGCVWGGALTAVRLEDRAVTHVPCAD
ncbi:MAG: symmetrical bis(5'-nucleosyl)-tetraphosphatase [Myxococcota bacterium]